MTNNSCVVIILTFNSEEIILQTVEQALKISPEIFIVDSGSSDKTLEIIRNLGCTYVHKEFINYSKQRNWAIQKMAHHKWQLHLDADEVLDPVAISAIRNVISGHGENNAYMIKRRDYFMGKMLRYSGLNPWHLRLFRSEAAVCEDRLYDQHFVTQTKVGRLNGFMHDKNSLSISQWIGRHNRWSDLEAIEIYEAKGNPSASNLNPKAFGDPRERTRFQKNTYYKFPALIRVLMYFIYRYFICLGFLDGVVGFYFIFFQALWFRMVVDVKIEELKKFRLNVIK